MLTVKKKGLDLHFIGFSFYFLAFNYHLFVLVHVIPEGQKKWLCGCKDAVETPVHSRVYGQRRSLGPVQIYKASAA